MRKHLPNQTTHFLLVIMCGGLFIGLGLSWTIYNAPGNSAKPVSSESAPTIIPKLTASQSGNTPQPVVEVGKQAPDFSLKDIDGEEIHLSDFSGKPVLINLWATWCIPCQNEMPVLEKIYKDKNALGLVVLGVNITSQDNLETVKETVKKYQLSYPILLDESGQISKLYQVHGIPSSYFIDQQGVLRRIQIGEILPEYLDSYFSEILPFKENMPPIQN
jgi:peroxiredoxin